MVFAGRESSKYKKDFRPKPTAWNMDFARGRSRSPSKKSTSLWWRWRQDLSHVYSSCRCFCSRQVKLLRHRQPAVGVMRRLIAWVCPCQPSADDVEVAPWHRTGTPLSAMQLISGVNACDDGGRQP